MTKVGAIHFTTPRRWSGTRSHIMGRGPKGQAALKNGCSRPTALNCPANQAMFASTPENSRSPALPDGSSARSSSISTSRHSRDDVTRSMAAVARRSRGCERFRAFCGSRTQPVSLRRPFAQTGPKALGNDRKIIASCPTGRPFDEPAVRRQFGVSRRCIGCRPSSEMVPTDPASVEPVIGS